MTNWHLSGYKNCVKAFKDEHKAFHLVDVGVPHLGEEPEGRWGVWVVYRELDPSLRHKTGIYMWLYTVLLQHTV